MAVSWHLGDGALGAYDEAIAADARRRPAALVADTPTHAGTARSSDGFLLVVLVWTVLPAFAALPLLIYFWPKLSFTDAYFETMSGLTTTGATVLDGLDKLPYSINFWRGMNWSGWAAWA